MCSHSLVITLSCPHWHHWHHSPVHPLLSLIFTCSLSPHHPHSLALSLPSPPSLTCYLSPHHPSLDLSHHPLYPHLFSSSSLAPILFTILVLYQYYYHYPHSLVFTIHITQYPLLYCILHVCIYIYTVIYYIPFMYSLKNGFKAEKD